MLLKLGYRLSFLDNDQPGFVVDISGGVFGLTVNTGLRHQQGAVGPENSEICNLRLARYHLGDVAQFIGLCEIHVVGQYVIQAGSQKHSSLFQTFPVHRAFPPNVHIGNQAHQQHDDQDDAQR